MRPRDARIDDQQATGWPVLVLLSVAVLVPTACVLWFMAQAMRTQAGCMTAQAILDG